MQDFPAYEGADPHFGGDAFQNARSMLEKPDLRGFRARRSSSVPSNAVGGNRVSSWAAIITRGQRRINQVISSHCILPSSRRLPTLQSSPCAPNIARDYIPHRASAKIRRLTVRFKAALAKRGFRMTLVCLQKAFPVHPDLRGRRRLLRINRRSCLSMPPGRCTENAQPRPDFRRPASNNPGWSGWQLKYCVPPDREGRTPPGSGPEGFTRYVAAEKLENRCGDTTMEIQRLIAIASGSDSCRLSSICLDG